MNSELNEINNLLREKAQLDLLMFKMDEQKESIRQYCLAALRDIKENVAAILSIVRANLNLFPLNKYKEFCARGDSEHKIVTFKMSYNELEIRTNINYRDANGLSCVAEACMGYFFCGIKGVDGRIAELTKEKCEPLDWWTDQQKKVDCGKKWIELVICIVKEHISRIVNERKEQLNNGIEASSKEYVKIVA